MEAALQCVLSAGGSGKVGNEPGRPARDSMGTTSGEVPPPELSPPDVSQAGADSTLLHEVVLRINRDDRVAGSCRVEVALDIAPEIAADVVRALLAQAASRVESFADRIHQLSELGATRIVVHSNSVWGEVGSPSRSAEQPFLTEAQWAVVLQAAFPPLDDRRKYRPQGVRRFIESVLWVVCVDCVWSDLPPGRGSWRSVYVRFLRWASAGVWPRVAAAMGDTSGPGRMLLERHNRYLTDAARIRQRRRKDQ